MIRRAVLALVLGTATWAEAQGLPDWTPPAGATLTDSRTDPAGLYALPAGVYDGVSVPTDPVEAIRTRQAWAKPLAPGENIFGIFEGLSAAVTAAGYQTLVRCGAAECGGFDFRQVLELLPPPAMFLDLAEFYVLSAQREDEAVLVVVSRSARLATWQMTWFGAVPEPPEPPVVAPVATQTAEAPSPVEDIERKGHVVLDGVTFVSGATHLAEIPPSLIALADYLKAHPEAKVLIVGHSDSIGQVQANLSLSRTRAEAVVQTLVTELAVPQPQVQAEAAGPFAPRASNGTPEGRALNRRVEAVLLVTERP